MSWRKAVLSAAACSKVSGGTSRVLVRPGAEALAMMAMPHDPSGRRPMIFAAGQAFNGPCFAAEPICCVHAIPLRESWFKIFGHEAQSQCSVKYRLGAIQFPLSSHIEANKFQL